MAIREKDAESWNKQYFLRQKLVSSIHQGYSVVTREYTNDQ